MLEEIVRATVISLFERDKLKEWPSVDDMSMIIADVQEIHSANLEEEEDYDEGQPDWFQEWHDFDPEA